MKIKSRHVSSLSTVVTSAALILVAGCGGSSTPHTSNAVACRSVVSDLRKVAVAVSTISTKPKEFVSAEPAFAKALKADVQNVGKGALGPAVQDFTSHLDNLGKALGNSKPPAPTDATAFGVDAQKIDGVCKAAGVSSNSG